MRYTYAPADPVWYATDLRLDTERGVLRWTGGRGQDALLVRTPYGTDPEERMEELCAALSRTELREGRFTELSPVGTDGSGGYGARGPFPAAARLVSPLEKARNGGCPPEAGACTYTVFACQTEGDARRLYGHQRGEISSPRCGVPLRVQASVEEAAARRGLFALGNRDGIYWRLSFHCPPGCGDGDLEYAADGFAVPVTRRMLDAGTVYVRSKARPRIVSRRPGIELE